MRPARIASAKGSNVGVVFSVLTARQMENGINAALNGVLAPAIKIIVDRNDECIIDLVESAMRRPMSRMLKGH